MEEFTVTMVVDRREWNAALEQFVKRDLAHLTPVIDRNPGHDIVLRVQVRDSAPNDAETFVREQMRAYATAHRWGDLRIISCSVTPTRPRRRPA